MDKFSLNKTQCIQQGIYTKNIRNQKLVSLYTKSAKFTLIRLTISEISPLLYLNQIGLVSVYAKFQLSSWSRSGKAN